jgi:DNA polymerase epsilon subunit 2
MEDPVATAKPPAPIFNGDTPMAPNEQPFSSSPGFGTPAYPIASRPAQIARPFVTQRAANVTPTVLPILLPPQTLRPVAFRTLTKKYNLTLTSSGLGLLSTFVGKFCGSGWREEGLAERVLDEVAKAWKRAGGNVLVEDGPEKKLTAILKSLEPCMSAGRLDLGILSRTNSSIGGTSISRHHSLDVRPGPSREDSQTSLRMSGLDMDDGEAEEDTEAVLKQDARSYMKVISAHSQPQLMYSTTKKSLEPVSTAQSFLPPISHKIALFRNRYNLVHQRLMRNESFQTPSFSMARGQLCLGLQAMPQQYSRHTRSRPFQIY